MARKDHRVTAVEEAIRNLSRIGHIGMAKVDDTMIEIMAEKTASPPPAE